MSNRENTTIRRNRQDYNDYCRNEMDRLAYDMYRIKCLTHVLFKQSLEALENCSFETANACDTEELFQLAEVIYKTAKASYEAH